MAGAAFFFAASGETDAQEAAKATVSTVRVCVIKCSSVKIVATVFKLDIDTLSTQSESIDDGTATRNSNRDGA